MNFDVLFPDLRETGKTPLRQSQLVMLRMLKIFDYLCTKHGIEYFLTGGSLLGAIRHQGFIPWDDDVDVGMTRKNFEKFTKYAVPELPYDIFFQSPETDPAYASTRVVEARLRDKYSTYSVSEATRSTRNFHHGIMVDIFVYDRAFLPSNLFIFLVNRIMMFFFWKSGPNNTNNQKRAKILKAIERMSPLPLVYASTYMDKPRKIKEGGVYKTQREIASLVRTRFEDMEALIPVGWHTYLQRMYGDYMKLPPPEKQVAHSKKPPQPFTPCNHSEILYWKDRAKTQHNTTHKIPLNEL